MLLRLMPLAWIKGSKVPNVAEATKPVLSSDPDSHRCLFFLKKNKKNSAMCLSAFLQNTLLISTFSGLHRYRIPGGP